MASASPGTSAPAARYVDGKSRQVTADTEQLLDFTRDGLAVFDCRRTIQWVNRSFCRITGWRRDEVIGRDAGLLVDPGDAVALWNTVNTAGQFSGEILGRDRHGHSFPAALTVRALVDGSGTVGRYGAVLHDLSRRKQADETIRTLTCLDDLTRLPNRHLFGDRLTQAIGAAERSRRLVVLAMVGLDGLKAVNETFGHRTGDTLLRQASERLIACLRGHDTVARLRGDVFCCLLTDFASAQDARLVLTRLCESFAAPFAVTGNELYLSASVGVSVYPLDGANPDELLRKAETAVSRARRQADTPIRFYTPEMHAEAVARLQMDGALRKAAARGELEVHYQPKVVTATGRIVGAEALLRWTHPEMGAISPARFIPIAEETGLILQIGDWVLESVCAQLNRWRAEGRPVVQVAVNLSAHQLRQPDLVERIDAVIAAHGLPPELLELELTESAVMANAEQAVTTLSALHARGVRLTVDDFGTGYSSLSYLKRFPLDTLKIDRSFIQDIDANPASADIVTAIIAMAHALDLTVVAEGVETKAQHDVLHRLECDQIQGYYHSKPIPAAAFAALMDARGVRR
ncbi:MAG: EAL domain-containing protein [Magnetospirillum sp.]|nr:EAL domain-containing protein [Magnetospirillum sp.]